MTSVGDKTSPTIIPGHLIMEDVLNGNTTLLPVTIDPFVKEDAALQWLCNGTSRQRIFNTLCHSFRATRGTPAAIA
eukprot:15280475-Ditylum_brightwellii.AAC.2